VAAPSSSVSIIQHLVDVPHESQIKPTAARHVRFIQRIEAQPKGSSTKYVSVSSLIAHRDQVAGQRP
jgi:hypothetical protein